MNDGLNIVRADSCRIVLSMMTNSAYDDYNTFATSRQPIGQGPGRDAVAERRDFHRGASGSLEALHGQYHGLVAGGGHMSAVGCAAFDPIFWLHHW